jgi:hypothetical protein
MRRLIHVAASGLILAGAVACYRLPLRIRENDASGYEEVGIPTIEAVEYTPGGRDLRVSLESPGYVTVIIVDPERGATVRFRRGELHSQWVDKGVHRFALDRLSSPMMLAQFGAGASAAQRPRGMQSLRPAAQRASAFDPAPIFSGASPAADDSLRRELRLESQRVGTGSGPVTSTHVVVIVTEQALDLVGVATRLARGSLDPALVAQAAVDVVEGGRWMAAVAPLRGQ